MERFDCALWLAVFAGLIGASAIVAASPAGAAQAIVVAQSGAVGGTVGKRDKTVTGSETQPTPKTRSQRNKRPADQSTSPRSGLPQTIRLTETSIGGTYTCTLRRTSGGTYEGKWNVAIASRMTVTLTDSTMVVVRQDVSNTVNGMLWNGTYSGTRTGNTATGTFSHGVGGTWTASW